LFCLLIVISTIAATFSVHWKTCISLVTPRNGKRRVSPTTQKRSNQRSLPVLSFEIGLTPSSITERNDRFATPDTWNYDPKLEQHSCLTGTTILQQHYRYQTTSDYRNERNPESFVICFVTQRHRYWASDSSKHFFCPCCGLG
jgi:hypothetical protein